MRSAEVSIFRLRILMKKNQNTLTIKSTMSSTVNTEKLGPWVGILMCGGHVIILFIKKRDVFYLQYYSFYASL